MDEAARTELEYLTQDVDFLNAEMSLTDERLTELEYLLGRLNSAVSALASNPGNPHSSSKRALAILSGEED